MFTREITSMIFYQTKITPSENISPHFEWGVENQFQSDLIISTDIVCLMLFEHIKMMIQSKENMLRIQELLAQITENSAKPEINDPWQVLEYTQLGQIFKIRKWICFLKCPYDLTWFVFELGWIQSISKKNQNYELVNWIHKDFGRIITRVTMRCRSVDLMMNKFILKVEQKHLQDFKISSRYFFWDMETIFAKN